MGIARQDRKKTRGRNRHAVHRTGSHPRRRIRAPGDRPRRLASTIVFGAKGAGRNDGRAGAPHGAVQPGRTPTHCPAPGRSAQRCTRKPPAAVAARTLRRTCARPSRTRLSRCDHRQSGRRLGTRCVFTPSGAGPHRRDRPASTCSSIATVRRGDRPRFGDPSPGPTCRHACSGAPWAHATYDVVPAGSQHRRALARRFAPVRTLLRRKRVREVRQQCVHADDRRRKHPATHFCEAGIRERCSTTASSRSSGFVKLRSRSVRSRVRAVTQSSQMHGRTRRLPPARRPRTRRDVRRRRRRDGRSRGSAEARGKRKRW